MNWKHYTQILDQFDFQKVKTWILAHPWETVGCLFLLWLLMTKDFDIQVQLSSPVALGEAPYPSSQTTSLRENHLSLGELPFSTEKPAAAPKVDKRPANTFSNVTLLLSPDYAKRKGIPKEIADAKLKVCKDYVRQFAPTAQEEMKKFGIPASITLAQGLLESNAGESRLSVESKNHFGIKCRSKCRGCTCRNYTDDDVYDMFRVFSSPWESFREHSQLLNSARYQHLKKLGKRNYKSWAYGLKKAGYATDKRYAEKLIQIIEVLDLHQYD